MVHEGVGTQVRAYQSNEKKAPGRKSRGRQSTTANASIKAHTKADAISTWLIHGGQAPNVHGINVQLGDFIRKVFTEEGDWLGVADGL